MEKEKLDLDIERVLYETLQNLEYLNETILRSHSIRFTNAEYDRFCSCMDVTRCNLNDLEKILQKKDEECFPSIFCCPSCSMVWKDIIKRTKGVE